MKIDYTNLSFTQLIDKIEANRFFDLPRMARGAFRRLLSRVEALEDAPAPTGEFIPITGTEVGNPVTGDISTIEGVEINSNSVSVNRAIRFAFGNGIEIQTTDIASGDDSDIQVQPNYIYISATDGTSSYRGEVDVESNGTTIDSNDPASRGIKSQYDYTANITDLDYTQKKYVDQKVADSRPYKVYTALLTQSGTNAPTAIILENTAGLTITWGYDTVGTYSMGVGGSRAKFYVSITRNTSTAHDVLYTKTAFGEAYLGTYDTGVASDDILSFTPIEIRVYN